MKTLTWFTHTNIDTRQIFVPPNCFSESPDRDPPSVSFDLSEFIQIFKDNEIWKRKKYRSEYNYEYEGVDLDKIKSIKIHLHSKDAPYSNCHNYENVLKNHIKLESFESSKIASSNISEASQIAVVVVDFQSENKVMNYLSYEEEKDFETVFEKRLSEKNHTSWLELKKIKSIICEFIQFFTFNLHLIFLTHSYEFSFTEKPNFIGFTTVTEDDKFSFETDKIDFFAHYILYQKEQDKLFELMRNTSTFWHKEIPSIHFFLDALKGNHVTATSFIKLLFTLESFFGHNTSTDFMILSVSQILGTNKGEMEVINKTLRPCFKFRNEIVHGGNIHNITFNSTFKYGKNNFNTSKLYFDLKNILIRLFTFFIHEKLYQSKNNEKINQQMLIRHYPSKGKVK